MRVNSTSQFSAISRRASIQTLFLMASQGLWARGLSWDEPGPTAGESLADGNGLAMGRFGSARHAFFAGTAPFAGVTHFDDAITGLPANLLPATPSPATVSDVGNPSLYPGFGAKATGWDFGLTASSGNVTASFTGSGASGTIPATSDYCVRLNRSLAGETLTTVAVKSDDASLFRLLSVYLKLNLIPNNPSSLCDITLTGYKTGNPVASATKTLTSINTQVWTQFDVNAIAAFSGIDEFRFTSSPASGVTVSSMYVDEIALPTTPLPLVLMSFSGRRDQNNVLLQWETATEQNTRAFEVQRAIPGSAYLAIGEVAAAGNSSLPQNYHYTDTGAFQDGSAAAAGYLYRLKMTDLDDKFTYSPICRIGSAGENLSISAWPNPFRQQVSLFVQSPDQDDAQVSIRDMAGRQVQVRSMPVQKGGNLLQLSELEQLERGNYFITVATHSRQQTIAVVKMQ